MGLMILRRTYKILIFTRLFSKNFVLLGLTFCRENKIIKVYEYLIEKKL
jgi:hypothetical protein